MIRDQNFKPEELFDVHDSEEDQIYLSEYKINKTNANDEDNNNNNEND